MVAAALTIGKPAHAAPPPDSTGQFRDWFRSLRVPGSPSMMCCTIADCRMVDSRLNPATKQYEAKVVREKFQNALQHSILYEHDSKAFEDASRIWAKSWIERFGDISDVWIEIPQERTKLIDNPTGRAVLCWSVWYSEFNGVFCFVPPGCGQQLRRHPSALRLTGFLCALASMFDTLGAL
jgi:hypothetical protein